MASHHGPSRPRAAPPSTADKYPGGGARQLDLELPSVLPPFPPAQRPTLPPFPSSSTDIHAYYPPSAAAVNSAYATPEDDWAIVCEQRTTPPVEEVVSPDALLDRGIADYNVVPGGRLGRGKFSVVYRAEKAGKERAIKHTPLHPHHPLIASRLIREPALLAQLPPHPNLVKVFETIRTEGHFYLVEEYLPSAVSLDTLCLSSPDQRLPISLVQHILDQLVSVARDAMHVSSVCHRDIKPENVLVDPLSGHITLIDLGLATHFSLSAPKLTTCCGSPAFHCPEIVKSLSLPVGVVTYWGPEVDVWCIALTVLRCWSGKRYPLGTSHTNLVVMRGRVEDALASLEVGRGRENGRELRETLRSFLDIDGERRMEAFKRYDVGGEVRRNVENYSEGRDFKQTTFSVTTPKYTLPIYPVPLPLESRTSSPARAIPKAVSPQRSQYDQPLAMLEKEPPASSTIVLRNPEDQHPIKVVSFLKFALRSANILYHTRSTNPHSNLHFRSSNPSSPFQTTSRSTSVSSTPSSSNPSTPSSSLPKSSFVTPPSYATAPENPPLDILQCVLVLPALPPAPRPVPLEPGGFLTSLFRSSTGVRSASTPPTSRTPLDSGTRNGKRSQSGSRKEGGKDRKRCLVFFIAFRFSPPVANVSKGEQAMEERRRRSQSRRGRRSGGGGAGGGLGSRAGSLARERGIEEGSSTGSRYNSPSRVARIGSDTSNSSNNTTTGDSAASSSDANSLLDTPSPMSPLPLPRQRRPTSRIRASSTAGLRSASSTTERAAPSRHFSHQHSHSNSHPHQPHPINNPYPSADQSVEPFILVHLSDPLALTALHAAFSIAPPPPPPPASVSAPPSTTTVHASTFASPLAAVDIPSPTESLSETEEEEDVPRGRSSGRMSDNSYSSQGTHSGSSTHFGKPGMRTHHASRSSQLQATQENRDRDATPRGEAVATSPPSEEEEDDDVPLSPPPPQGRALFPFFEGGLFEDLQAMGANGKGQAERGMMRPGYQRSLSTTGRLTLDR